MASLFKDPNKLSAYRDRRFPGTQDEYEHALQISTTVYIGNLSFYTTEEQVYELFSRVGEIKKIIMGLDKNSKTPCGFCFVLNAGELSPVNFIARNCTLSSIKAASFQAVLSFRYYSREDAEDSVKYISGTILDDRPIRADFDWGFEEGRQWGRGRSGGQVRDEYRTDYDPEGGYGKLIQRELEAQRQLVDYGEGSLDSFQPNISHYEGRNRDQPGGGYRGSRDYYHKRYRDEERTVEHDSKNSDHDSRMAKNPRFRERGDSDDEEDDGKRRRR